MKIAIVTDTHFGARNDNQNFNEYFYKFYENVFFPYLKDKGITTCVHMGDVVDRRKFISYRIANDFRKRFIGQFQKDGIDLHIMSIIMEKTHNVDSTLYFVRKTNDRINNNMNQKFGDLFAKFLFIFFIWTCIAFIFEIGW